MPTSQTFVIVGASLAGAKAAEELRRAGFGGRIVLIGEEAVRPYERPPLSKAYLQGAAGFDKAAVHDESWYTDHDVDLLVSTAVISIDTGTATVALSTGESVRYDRLLIATGCSPRKLSVPGSDLPGVHYLRTIEDSDAIRQAIAANGHIVIIGAGWIGTEVAASARLAGAEVDLVDMASSPLEASLGPEIAAVYRDIHLEHSVRMHMNTTVEAIRGAGVVEEVVLAGGNTVPAAAVVIGVGAAPRAELALAAGIEVEDGIATDQFMETSVPGVYAAGDVACTYYPFYGTRIRLEHWDAAINQGKAAARSMLGEQEPYDRIPYLYSDQYDVGMEYTGYARTWDRVVVRGDASSREFIAFWIKDGRVAAGMNVNIWDVADRIESLVRSRQPVKESRLADPSEDLTSLVPET